MFGLKPEVIELFTPFFKYADGRLIFNYGNAGFESWAPEWHHVPSTLEIWLAGGNYPNLIADLYISNSAAELLSFSSQRSFNLLKHPEQMAFVAVGLRPSAAHVNALKTAFPFARWHLLFGPDLLGRVADAAIASWYKGRSVSFRLSKEQVIISYCGKSFVLESGMFSLSRFERLTALRAGMRTHKPPRGLPSFIALQFAEQ
jgi:hypothetical protein